MILVTLGRCRKVKFCSRRAKPEELLLSVVKLDFQARADSAPPELQSIPHPARPAWHRILVVSQLPKGHLLREKAGTVRYNTPHISQ